MTHLECFGRSRIRSKRYSFWHDSIKISENLEKVAFDDMKVVSIQSPGGAEASIVPKLAPNTGELGARVLANYGKDRLPAGGKVRVMV
jgi:hypothetical protein